jgi:hypothetical protein
LNATEPKHLPIVTPDVARAGHMPIMHKAQLSPFAGTYTVGLQERLLELSPYIGEYAKAHRRHLEDMAARHSLVSG